MRNPFDFEDDDDEEIVEETSRKTGKGKVVKILLFVFGIPALIAVGLAIGIFFTQKSFDDDREQIATLQEEASSFEERSSTAEQELEDAIARAEEAEEKLKDLQTINDSLEERVKELREGLSATSETPSEDAGLSQDYISWKFWTDGNQYRATDKGTVFYSDPDYETGLETSEVILVSRVVSPDKIQDETGEIITVYTALSTEGFVYCQEVPNLEPIQ